MLTSEFFQCNVTLNFAKTFLVYVITCMQHVPVSVDIYIWVFVMNVQATLLWAVVRKRMDYWGILWGVCVEWKAAVLFTQSAASFSWKHHLLHKNSNCAFTTCHSVSANTSGIQFPPLSVHATLQLVQIRKTMSASFLTPQTCSSQHWSAALVWFLRLIPYDSTYTVV